MSYRDIRNFIEMLRALNYPSLISMESFRKPNFPLVADLLIWLSKRFDLDTEIPLKIDTEDERVQLIRDVAKFMAVKVNVKLNTKKLYQADGYCIKELLKITSLLYEALNVNLDQNASTDDNFNIRNYDLTDKMNELKLSRQLASEITSSGASLFDLLGKEIELKPIRQKSMIRQFEINDVELGLKKSIDNIKKQINETKQLIDNVSTTEISLDSKIERRKVEIDRYEKRLQTLKKVRPAFLEEFTNLETELEQLFVQFSTKSRILSQLEKQFKESERVQNERLLAAENTSKIKKIPFEDTALTGLEEREERQERPRASTGNRKLQTYGNMQKETPSTGSETESDDLFIDKDEPELLQSDEDDESLGIEFERDRRTSDKLGRGRSSSKMQQSHSDDDF